MSQNFPLSRVRQLLSAASRARVVVLGDVMLDQFLWGKVARISPEAPVPVVEFERESFIPGGAGNVARNLARLRAATQLLGVSGHDDAARRLRRLLTRDGAGCSGLLSCSNRATSIKTRIVAHRQQVVRVDRETRGDIDDQTAARLLAALADSLRHADALILADYAKGVITQPLLDETRRLCRARGVWLSLDPKPSHLLNLSGLSLLTPNRKEAFDLAGLPDEHPGADPARDAALRRVADKLLAELQPALLLITLGEHGLLLCQRGQKPFHVPTAAREVFDVSGAGDTVIASFTLAIVAGASPVEAAFFSNHAAGVVVGKLGTATVTPDELLASFPAED
ncbi:MAG: D-glycero-beta-D-manno-heptose-7-phosphate kinase [Verrucomicrobiota bacterium]|jgi:D-beta-D-heptose 7-phosphate kinase/D-beta-D-heptose 1-phosphate adenosyltransferase